MWRSGKESIGYIIYFPSHGTALTFWWFQNGLYICTHIRRLVNFPILLPFFGHLCCIIAKKNPLLIIKSLLSPPSEYVWSYHFLISKEKSLYIIFISNARTYIINNTILLGISKSILWRKRFSYVKAIYIREKDPESN